MKDRQGIMRGKCNECGECEEYVAPSEGARCDYCDHVPTQHVQIIKLGPCKCGECEEYMSEEKFSYTNCEYCGCKAAEHKGADKLKKKQPAHPKQPPMSPAYNMMGGGSPSVMMTPPHTSMPATPPNPNTCKYPGCNRTQYVEGNGKRHDFCGKDHARKFHQEFQTMSPGPSSSMPSSAGIPSSSLGPTMHSGMMGPPRPLQPMTFKAMKTPLGPPPGPS